MDSEQYIVLSNMGFLMLKLKSATGLFHLLFFLLLFVSLAVALITDGTNGGGDSVNHYMLSHFAWKHPYLFFDHWGKPVFTILSSPFAQFGIHGIKVFNVLVTFGATYLTYLISKRTQSNNFLWILPLYFCAPEGVKIIFSGLTEPIFAMLFAAALYLLYKKQLVASIIIASFLPLARSEGLIILIVFCIYLLANRKYLLLPLAFFGQLIIALLGYYVYNDILWVFNKIPYATLKSNYWTGPLTHYLKSMPGVFGWVSTILLFTGCLIYLLKTTNKLYSEKSLITLIDHRFVVYGSFIAFTLSHSVFYYLGIFNDMGLTRVFIAVFPTMVLISLDALDYIKWLLIKYAPAAERYCNVSLVLLMVFFCYIGSVYRINYQKDFSLDNGQKLFAYEVVPYVQKNLPGSIAFFSDISYAFFSGTDIYANNNRYNFEVTARKPDFKLNANEIIIWDSWFTVVEEHISLDTLQNNYNVRMVKSFSVMLENGTKKKVAIFIPADNK